MNIGTRCHASNDVEIGFDSEWVKRIMDCLTTVIFSVLWKGNPFGHVIPQRGLRQGYPLSPYLFLMCAEGFSRMLQDAERIGMYEETSGQKINFTKSALTLSPNATAVEKQSLGFAGNSVGLPIVTGRGRKQIFEIVKDRIRKRISRWKEKLLSRAGKEILIKAVLQAMPTYSMSCFRMPKGIWEGHRPSLIRSSLIWGKDLLKVGLLWRVGNGEDI
ncbi:Ribonuclease H-like superfamily protein [Prunus dulcis]|uniref:Ribonuclease H-like superfamily protein n=1 Tax=Prunus dulcis TaxID=3755 RepID=A0A4Y1RMM5_PRUDU|nr:Ribonuclease H-like superfamily protein [Prunus dulcis]